MTIRRAAALFTLALVTAAPAALAQTRPMPEDAALADAYLAWDRGDYPDALRGYLAALRGPTGAVHVREVALLTGELFQVTELTTDGADIQVSPDGSTGSYVTTENGETVTKIVDLATARVIHTLAGANVTLMSGGAAIHVVPGEGPGVEAASQALAEAQGRFQRMQALANLAWEQAKTGSARMVQDRNHFLMDRIEEVPLGFVIARGSADVYALAAPADDRSAAGLYRLVGGNRLELIPTRPGVLSTSTVVTATHVIYTSDGALLVQELVGNAARDLGPVGGFSVSNDGSMLAFTRTVGGMTHVEWMNVATGALRTLLRTDKEIRNPVVSPDGAWVAYQLMDLHDWEIFAAATDGSGERRLSLEIQHDRDPMWVDDTRVLAAKGEGRHMRSYLYDVAGGETLKLFHNNSVRTIAPEYEWAVAPGAGKILLIAERDGDTVSEERGVYLIDLETMVTRDQVVARLEDALAAELDLRERGVRAFGPIHDEVAMVADAVSTGRIFDYAHAVYQLGSKHITMPGNAHAIEYYADKLRSFGYEPELQWFEASGRRTANVIVRIPGTHDPDLVYVVSSHFDSTQRGPGADDDSSGATALLEAARVLQGHPMRATMELAFFTAEESGLLGSREYVRRAVADGKHIVGALNNDMVGWANDHRLDNTIRYSNPGIRDIQHAAAMQFSDLITYDALYYKSTDAAAYYEAYGDIVGGIGSYPVLGNPHYHQWTDRLETINQELVAQVSKTTIATLMLLASSPSRINGLTLQGGAASWDPSPESGIASYEVSWQTGDGWANARVTEPRATLDGLRPGGRVQVRAWGQNGTHGWDWARAGGM